MNWICTRTLTCSIVGGLEIAFKVAESKTFSKWLFLVRDHNSNFLCHVGLSFLFFTFGLRISTFFIWSILYQLFSLFQFYRWKNEVSHERYSMEIYNNKHMVTSTQRKSTKIFAFIAALVFKLLTLKVLFINRKENRNC